MATVSIRPDIHWIGVDDRVTDLFEGLWPISREGVSYNTYLINDEKKVIIDLTKSFSADDFFNQIDELIDVSKIDYVIINHMEPDHSGILRTLRRISPGIKIMGTEKTSDMLQAFYGITENVEVIKDGDELSTGKMTLKFFETPMVHWPETMMTYEVENNILFSCDAFGSYGSLGGSIFDDDCTDMDFYIDEALRYYSNIVVKFNKMVLRAIDKLRDVKIDIVAPSHGRIWRDNPSKIIQLYEKWSKWAEDIDKDSAITLIYGTMYGNTERMMNAVAHGISEAGVPLKIFDISRTHVSYILPSVLSSRGVMVGAPTYELGLFPPVRNTLKMAVEKGIKNRKTAWFGSYGWSGGARKEFEKIAEEGKWDIVGKMEFRGGAADSELSEGIEWGKKFAEEVKVSI